MHVRIAGKVPDEVTVVGNLAKVRVGRGLTVGAVGELVPFGLRSVLTK